MRSLIIAAAISVFSVSVQAAVIPVASVGAWNNWFQGDVSKSVREFNIGSAGDYLFSFSLTPDSSFEPNLASLHGVTWNFASDIDFGAHSSFVSSNVAANSYSGSLSFHADHAGLFRFDLGFTNQGAWAPNYSSYDQIWNGSLMASLSSVPVAPQQMIVVPVPEPTMPAMLGIGLLTLLFTRYRKKPAFFRRLVFSRFRRMR